ncbi:uncharacterized protein LOC127791794 [Diospyros lotus]|uniref:uncharacterized protein LOC127791794 n=1 Tax=Diospyros lotus TaxID=55363 RepID=UPI0022504C3B|nr:uncharacterized protein LOC127791794 [Diospyros lotus]
METSSSSSCNNGGPAAEDLLELEEHWFFGNPLQGGRTKVMSRCFSDPCPSSNHSPADICLTKSSSSMAVAEACQEGEGSSKFTAPPQRGRNLLRTPSLPPYIGREEDPESEFSLSKLIRQASLSSSDELPPKHSSKVTKQGSSAPTPRAHRPKKKPEPEEVLSNGMELACDQAKMIIIKGSNDLESAKVQRFKDLGLGPDKKHQSPGEINPIPSLFQERKRVMIRRQYLPDQPWQLLQSSAPPSWVEKSSSAEAMKAQIKFWARAVASNAR